MEIAPPTTFPFFWLLVDVVVVSFDRYARWKITAVHFSLRHSSLHCHQPSSISGYLDIQHVGIVIRYNTTSVSSDAFFFFFTSQSLPPLLLPVLPESPKQAFFIKDVHQVEGQQHHVDEHMCARILYNELFCVFSSFFPLHSFFNLPPTPAAL